MRTEGLGPRGVASRMAELQARIDARLGRSAPARPPAGAPGMPQTDRSSTERALRESGLTGDFAGGPAAGMEPMAPFGRDAQVAGLAGRPGQGAARWRPLIERAAADAGIDPDLLQALVQAESGGGPGHVSRAGAMGLTQLMPATARSLGVQDPYDPEQNLRGGARYLGQLLRRYDTVELALAAYNAGPGAVDRAGGIPANRETPDYVRKVMTEWQAMKSR